MTFFQTNFGQIWYMFGVFKPYFYGILVSFFPQKGVWAFLERIYYTSRYSITEELLQLLDEFSFSYLFLVFLTGIPSYYLSVWRSWITCATLKKNMSWRICYRFEPNSDYIWERHVLKLLADGQVVFSKIFNFLHYLPDGIGSKWVNWYWGTYMKKVFITCVCYLYKLTSTILF